jgi:hypothetical protein
MNWKKRFWILAGLKAAAALVAWGLVALGVGPIKAVLWGLVIAVYVFGFYLIITDPKHYGETAAPN